MPPPLRYDAIVVGVGGMGSAALYHLAKRGLKVLGIEQFGVAHDRGSSHGLSRIIRLAYHEHESYVPLLKRAYTLWRELENDTGMDLLRITGCVEAAAADEAPGNCFENALHAAQLHNLEHEVLTGAEVNRRFPGYSFPDDYRALYQPDGGVLASERCIEAHVTAARASGAELHTGEKVLGWDVAPGRDTGDAGVTVVTDQGQYSAKRLVLTAGAWMPQLVPAMQALCVVQRQVIGWFEVQDPALFTPEAFPVFVLQDKLGYYYGFPTFDHPGMKIGKFYHLFEETCPDELAREITPADEEALRQAVRKFFPCANGRMSKAAACMFTNTPDQHFIIDLHPVHPEVVLCSACSGHGFKFCSVVGEVLADLAQKGSTSHDISLLRIDPGRTGHIDLMARLKQSVPLTKL